MQQAAAPGAYDIKQIHCVRYTVIHNTAQCASPTDLCHASYALHQAHAHAEVDLERACRVLGFRV